jgi:hypothetical protein
MCRGKNKNFTQRLLISDVMPLPLKINLVWQNVAKPLQISAVR